MRLKRSSIKKDLVFFFIPFILILAAGTFVCVTGKISSGPQLEKYSPVNVAGMLMIGAGLVINVTSAVTLWSNYSSSLVIREGHRLITRGIYRVVRHPIYFGTTVVFIGLAAYASSFYGALIMALLVPVFLVRIRMEEKLLIEEFGDAYLEYREKTSRIIPWIL